MAPVLGTKYYHLLEHWAASPVCVLVYSIYHCVRVLFITCITCCITPGINQSSSLVIRLLQFPACSGVNIVTTGGDFPIPRHVMYSNTPPLCAHCLLLFHLSLSQRHVFSHTSKPLTLHSFWLHQTLFLCLLASFLCAVLLPVADR